MNNSKYIKFKYLFDYPIALLLIIIFSPILLIVSLMILFTVGMPIFFIQKRVGLDKKTFSIIKFRTMNKNSLSDHQRITRLGKYLRIFKLDELPQLFNILRGEMSLIGPRPLLPEYNDLYSNKQNIRFLVKPGLTGLSQIKVLENKKLNWSAKLNFDQIYVNKLNFFFDLYILFITLKLIYKNKLSKNDEYDNFDKFKIN